VADFDKPQRTRILEREVQRGVHEKVQGGYGKYQGQSSIGSPSVGPGAWKLIRTGTWVPLDRARAIAAQYNVEELLSPIFNFRPSTESPPLAPKHITAASTKPRIARGGGGRAGNKGTTKKATSKLSTLNDVFVQWLTCYRANTSGHCSTTTTPASACSSICRQLRWGRCG